MKIITLSSALTALLLLALAPGANAQRVVDTARSSGDYAVATASGNINAPRSIRARISASPRQLVDVTWTMTCANRSGGAGSKSGQYRTRSGTRALRRPFSRAASCVVAVTAQLSRGGRLRVQILG